MVRAQVGPPQTKAIKILKSWSLFLLGRAARLVEGSRQDKRPAIHSNLLYSVVPPLTIRIFATIRHALYSCTKMVILIHKVADRINPKLLKLSKTIRQRSAKIYANIFISLPFKRNLSNSDEKSINYGDHRTGWSLFI